MSQGCSSSSKKHFFLLTSSRKRSSHIPVVTDCVLRGRHSHQMREGPSARSACVLTVEIQCEQHTQSEEVKVLFCFFKRKAGSQSWASKMHQRGHPSPAVPARKPTVSKFTLSCSNPSDPPSCSKRRQATFTACCQSCKALNVTSK